jgi:hypothetical protein
MVAKYNEGFEENGAGKDESGSGHELAMSEKQQSANHRNTNSGPRVQKTSSYEGRDGALQRTLAAHGAALSRGGGIIGSSLASARARWDENGGRISGIRRCRFIIAPEGKYRKKKIMCRLDQYREEYLSRQWLKRTKMVSGSFCEKALREENNERKIIWRRAQYRNESRAGASKARKNRNGK